MARSVEEVVQDLVEMKRLSDGPVMTMTWPAFYELNDIGRCRTERLNQIWDQLKAEQLIFGWADNVVLVSNDRNFAPAPILQ